MTARLGPDLAVQEVDLLLCQVAGKTIAVGAASVAEIIESAHATPLPEAPEWVEGVLSLRDIVAPLIDLRVRLGQPRSEPSQVLLVRRRIGRPMAMRVDRVVEILHRRLGDISPAPDGAGAGGRYLLGVVHAGPDIVPLCDVEEILTSEERVTLESLVATCAPSSEGSMDAER